ncbi:MAG: hypothetical protein HC807_08600, partial [Gammaproteobacteria bacterium]|nr:hypothetical protein [Gammaproteobacteria bacterium]
ETGKIAKLATSAVMATYGGTTVMATVMRAKPREGLDFFPMQVDYREKTSAAGKFPGGFRKREGAPNEKEVLTMRMIDRPIRPLWPKGFKNEVHVVCTVLSADMDATDKVVGLVAECRALGLDIEPPDVNRSHYRFTVSGDRLVRYGLGAVKGIGRAVIDALVAERRANGPYVSIFDFCKRAGGSRIGRRALEVLVKSGALDGSGQSPSIDRDYRACAESR